MSETHTEEALRAMVDFHLLRQFATYAEEGTLSRAAEKLNLTQPALSRNMMKLEDDLGVALFDRGKNRISLNDNGLFLLPLAKDLLDKNEELARKVRENDRRARTISLGVCAPAPVWVLAPIISSAYPHKTLQSEIATEEALEKGLRDGSYQLAVFPRPLDGEEWRRKPCCAEKLMFSLPRGHRYVRRKSLTFAEMDGESLILMNDIGFWNFVRAEKMPSSKFLVQSDRSSFNELLKASSLPAFATDLANKYLSWAGDRILVPISDPEAELTFHLVCKAGSERDFQALFSSL